MVIDLQSLDIAPNDWEWREAQEDLTHRIIDSTARVVVIQAEPGIGKTLPPLAAMIHAKKRGYALVQTRQLERQYLRDHASLVLMEGRSHFKCPIGYKSAAEAPCTAGVDCDLSGEWD